MYKNTIKIELHTERDQLVADRAGTVDLLVRCIPAEIAATQKRPRLNLSIVLDRSGSMQGHKIHEAREAAKFCIDNLRPADRAGMVIFDDKVSELFENQFITAPDTLKAQIDRVHFGGSTALHAAWRRGALQVSSNLDPSAINRVLLVTDGQANVGICDNATIIEHAAGLVEHGVSTTTIGIGRDFNEELLVPMGEAGGGNAWHVREPEDMRRIFETELSGLSSQVANNVRLEIRPGNGVSVLDVLNDFEKDGAGRYKLPNLIAGRPLDIVVRLSAPSQAEGEELDLAEVILTYDAQADGARQTVRSVLTRPFAPEDVVMTQAADPAVETARLLLENARQIRQMNEHIDRGDRRGAQFIRARMAAATRRVYKAAPSPELACEVESLEELREMLGHDPVMARKMGRFAASARQRGRERF
jgi:Ca-activated chloride channel family protein